MTARRLLFTIPLAALFLALTASASLDHALVVYAAPEMQSQFLRAYHPEQVLDRFKDQAFRERSQRRRSGRRSWRRHAFEKCRAGTRSALRRLRGSEDSMGKDMASPLTGTGAPILENSGNDRNGFHLRYVAGKSAGTVIIKPPKPIVGPGQDLHQLLCPGEVEVWIRISMKETWFQSGVSTSPSQQSLLSRLLI